MAALARIGALGLAVALSAWSAFMVTWMWRWFATPLGAIDPGFLTVWGLLTLAAILKPYKHRPDLGLDEAVKARLSAAATHSLMFAVGWGIHLLGGD